MLKVEFDVCISTSRSEDAILFVCLCVRDFCSFVLILYAVANTSEEYLLQNKCSSIALRRQAHATLQLIIEKMLSLICIVRINMVSDQIFPGMPVYVAFGSLYGFPCSIMLDVGESGTINIISREQQPIASEA